ncbi:MAG: potassium channel family protein [Dehalococcoidia bacterium]
MKVVIAGIGDIGRNVARNLSRHGSNQLVLIDTDERLCDQLAAEVDALVILGDAANPEILRKAQLQEADALVASTGSDSTNTVIAMLGSRFGVETIVVKLNDTGLRPACLEMGVSKIITPKISASAQIFGALHGFDRMDFSLGIREGMRLMEVTVREDEDKRLSEMDLPDDALVVGVLRENRVMFPQKGLRIEKDDLLLTLVADEKVAEELTDLFRPN